MKKFALSIAALCGLGFAGVNTSNAADWHGGRGYDNHRHVTVVKKYDPYYSTSSYNSKWNDGCFPTPVVRKPVHNHGHNHNHGRNDNWNDRYDYRRSAGPSQGFGFNTPDVNFWYGR